ncbi:hypothetical protein FRC01_005257 [Tulasnella sp. 417]|nr:hypothetical protein FRC01_005257 [Tulasnella sp. 417]
MYLMTCYFVSRGFFSAPHPLALEIPAGFGVELPRLAELPQLEEHFLRRARQALVDSLSFSDRLMDFLRGSVLVTLYLYLRGRYLEGYHIHCGAARLALSCGLHRIESHVFDEITRGRAPLAGGPSIMLLKPPANQIDLAERITTFWMIYLCDKMSSVCAGFIGALPDEGSAIDAIRTVFPRRIEEYEEGIVTGIYNTSLTELFNATAPPAGNPLPDIPWTVTLKGLSLLDRATRLGATFRLDPTHENILAIRKLESAATTFRSTLPPFTYFVTPTSSALSMSYHDLGMFIGHTSSLGALLEIHQTLVDVGENEYEARLECAVDVAKLARVAKDGGLVNSCLISAGYCWSLAARVLVQHIESNYGTEPYAVDYESHLADVVTALELLSLTFPALLHQFGQVQMALGRVRGLGSTFSVETAEF